MSKLLSLCSKRETTLDCLPFIYCSSSLTARILRCSVRDYLEQPTVLANSVISINQLFNPDGIVLGYNPSLVEECWGGSVEYLDDLKLPACTRPSLAAGFVRTKALDAMVQAIQWAKKIRGNTALIAPVPGISYLWECDDEALRYEKVNKVGIAVAEANPDVVAVYERSPLPEGYEAGLEPLLNVLEHYGIISMLVLACEVISETTAVRRFNSVLVNHQCLPSVLQDTSKVWGAMLSFGVTPPQLAPGAYFVSTPWEVASDSPIFRVREIRNQVVKVKA